MNETQHKLIAAADFLLQENGLVRSTTRVIAKQAGVSEGLLYHYFRDKAELIHEVVFHRLRNLHETLDSLPSLVGQNTVEENLTRVLEIAYEAHYRAIPIICAVFSDYKLRNRIREIVRERQIGPDRSINILAAYLMAEQSIKRISAGINAISAAKLLFASSCHGAMVDHFLANRTEMHVKHLEIRDAVRMILVDPKPSVHLT
ncbi:MAG: TetR/AcrR family transcriptional regulator [Deltaproteobacteria bacterium]|nr:TetR/AcrR family transcriptional regulator [Deltaproteobacteria bacterium]